MMRGRDRRGEARRWEEDHIQSIRDSVGSHDIGRPDSSGESISRIIGELYGLLLGVEWHCDNDWTEDLFSPYLHGWGDLDDGGGVIVSPVKGRWEGWTVSTSEHLASLFPCFVDHCRDASFGSG
jgi:hypothetical protein